MAESKAAIEQTRQKRALQKENSTGSSSRSLEAAVRWGTEVLGCDWHAELQRVQPTVIKVVQHGCNQLPKKVTDELLFLHSVVSHRKVIAYRASHDGSTDSFAANSSVGGGSLSNSSGTLSGGSAKNRGSSGADMAALQQQQLDEQRRFSIPLAYEGWFEILNEDGQAAPPFTRVSQLAEALPRAFLVREKCKAYYCSDTSTSVPGREPSPDKSRTVHGGELMAVVGVTSAMLGWRHRRKRSLHCLDEAGSALYFDCDSRCSFSPVASASSGDVIGVHRIATIADTFRMPLTVRSVGGRKACTGAAGPGAPGCFRLTEVRTDEVALLLPLRTGGSLVPVSARMRLQVMAAENRAELQSRDDFIALQQACSAKAEAYFKTIQVLVSTDRRSVGNGAAAASSSLAACGNDQLLLPPPGGRQYSRTFSHEEDWVPPPLPSLPLPRTPTRRGSSSSEASERADSLCRSQPSSEEDLLFDEVDDLYDYVRRGGEPPKPRPRSWANQEGGSSSGGGRPAGSDGPPPERRLDDEGRSSSQPILSSNGVMRGRLAELTSGRFPRQSSRSSPAVAAGLTTVPASTAIASCTAAPSCTDAAVPADSTENGALAADAAIAAAAIGNPSSRVLLSSTVPVPTVMNMVPPADATLEPPSSPVPSTDGRHQRLASSGNVANESVDEHNSMIACGGASLASSGSITSTHSQAHLCGSKPDLAANDGLESQPGAAGSMAARLLASRLLLLPAQKQQLHCSGVPLLVVSDGDSLANTDDTPAESSGRRFDFKVAASEEVTGGMSTRHSSSCSTPESRSSEWPSHDSGSSLAMDRLRVPSRDFESVVSDSGRGCVSSASSATPQCVSATATAVHDGRYATLSHPAAASSRRNKLAQTPYRSTGDLVQLFEKLSTTTAPASASTVGCGGQGGGGGLHPSVLTLRRRSQGGVLSEGRLQLRTPPSEPEDFDIGSKATMSDSIRRRITTLKLSARAIMV